MSNQHYIYLGRIDGKLWLAADTCLPFSDLPRIEYLGQETDFQMYQAVREGVDFEEDYYCCKYDYSIHQCDRQCLAQGRYVALPLSKEPAATIQAIREATERHTTSPEAAREFLQEAGIEDETTPVERWESEAFVAACEAAEVVLKYSPEGMWSMAHINTFQDQLIKRGYAIQKLPSQQRSKDNGK